MSSITSPGRISTRLEDWPRRVEMFGIRIDAIAMTEAVSVVHQWISTSESSECQYVVTPNVDHVVLLQHHRGLCDAYKTAGLVLADGWPIVAASRLLRRKLPERVAGSDLVPRVFASADEFSPLRTYLLGAAPGVGVRAAENIQRRWPGVKVVGVDSPPIGFERHADENETILSRVAAADVDLLIVGLGAPKQELWVHAHRHALRAKVAICAGATIDFLAGEKKRAPKWMQRVGLEWMHRLCSEPKRLGRRYLKDGLAFPGIVWREMRATG
jgi:N-acetylglucosaminyldiphosphoundecaprenol N-acetyl-beta-D-mannosaminyltransferase